MPITTIFFDIDGTLADSNDFHVRAWDEAFREAGYRFDAQTIHDQIGKGTDNLVPTLIPGLSEEAQERLGKAHGEVFKTKYLPQVRLFADARALLVHAHGRGQTVVLASSASKEELDHYLDQLDAHDIVSTSTSSDDVENTKPAPDIFATAMKKVGLLDPAAAMVVGDTPYDIEAAGKCGIAALAVRSGKFPDAMLRDAGAAAIYDDVTALLADYEGSPLAA